MSNEQEKIFLRLVHDGLETKVVDQFGRELDSMKSVKLDVAYDEINKVTVVFYEQDSNGKLVLGGAGDGEGDTE